MAAEKEDSLAPPKFPFLFPVPQDFRLGDFPEVTISDKIRRKSTGNTTPLPSLEVFEDFEEPRHPTIYFVSPEGSDSVEHRMVDGGDSRSEMETVDKRNNKKMNTYGNGKKKKKSDSTDSTNAGVSTKSSRKKRANGM